MGCDFGVGGWGEGIDRWWWPDAEDYRRQIVWRGSKNEHVDCVRAINRVGYEARPSAFDVLGLPEVCVPFYDPTPMPDIVNSDWVYAFTGTYGDFDACSEAGFGVGLMDPYLDFYTFVYRDEKLGFGFRFLGEPAFGVWRSLLVGVLSEPGIFGIKGWAGLGDCGWRYFCVGGGIAGTRSWWG